MLIIHAHLQVIPAQEEAFLQAVKGLVAASQAEAGNLGYVLMKSTEQEHCYTMVEKWADAAAVAAHNASAHFQAFIKQAPAFVSAPMEVEVFAGEPVKL